MRLLFARHGESEANVQRVISNRDLPHRLTATGVAQAEALADLLAEQSVEMIWASPIVRAQETAAIVGRRLGLPVVTTSALREFDCGRMEGRGDAAAWAAHHAVTQAWDEAQEYGRRIEPDGESYEDMKARFLPFVSSLTAEHAHLDGAILLISHGAVLHLMLPLLLANVDRAFTREHPLANCALVTAYPHHGQITCVDWAGTKLT